MVTGKEPRVPGIPRSFVALACIATGFLLARNLQPIPAALWFGLAGFCCGGAAVGRGRPCAIALCLAALCFGGGWFSARLYQRSASSLDLLLWNQPSPVLVTIEGVVLDTPERIAHERSPLDPPLPPAELARTRLGVRAIIDDAGTSRPASGILRLALPTRDLPRAGELCRITGEFKPLAAPLNPGERDRRVWSTQEGVIGSLRSSKPADSLGVAGTRGAFLQLRATLGDRARTILLGSLEEQTPARALLGALVLGEDEPALREIRGSFQRLGLLHALSISGFHFMVMVLVALTLLRAATDLGWIEPVLVAILVIVYVAILPFNAPVWRSAMMVLSVVLSHALGRRYDTLTILGWTAVLLLLWRPMDLWSIGFQLSFGLVAALIACGQPVHERLWGMKLRGAVIAHHGALHTLLEHMKRLVSANVLCWAIATPLVMYHTGVLSILAVPVGLVMVPLIALLLIAGYAVLLVGVVVPALAELASSLAGALASGVASMAQILDRIPFASVSTPPVSILWTLFATAVLGYWLLRGRWRDPLAWSLAAAASLWLAAESALMPRPPQRQAIRVDAIAVGDGTCMLVRSGRDAVLWDCGSLTPRVGEYTIPRALRELGVWRVATVVVTHPNLDHFNALPDLIEPLGIRRVFTGEEFLRQAKAQPWGAEAYILERLSERGVEHATIAAGDTLTQGALRFSFLSPPRGSTWKPDNELSLVASVTSNNVPISATAPVLLTGDIERQAMQHLMAAHPQLRAGVLEAPHHGSARPAALEFITALRPAAVLQSTGPQRAGHWKSLREQVRWLTTAADGASWAAIRRDGSIETGSHTSER